MRISKHNLIVLVIAMIVSVFLIMRKRNSGETISSRVFRSERGGWGYDILVDKKLFIRQESVPVYSGLTGFPKEEQAAQTAALVIRKLKDKKSPVLTAADIQPIYNGR